MNIDTVPTNDKETVGNEIIPMQSDIKTEGGKVQPL